MLEAFRVWEEIERDSRGGAKLLRTYKFCQHAYRVAVWHSRHDIL